MSAQAVHDFLMPALGADMETGKVVRWNVNEGDRIRPGDVVCVVETHKGEIDVEIFLDGVIGSLAPLGEELPVGARLANVRGAEAPAGAAPPPAERAPEPETTPATASRATGAAAGAAVRPAAPATRPAGARARVSPAARRRAAALGIDPDALAGSGADGAVTLADVGRAAEARRPAARAEAPPTTRPARGFDPAQMRQAIAAAMARSKREIPHYYLGTTIDFGAAATWLEDFNRDRSPAERLLPAVLLLKAAARALVAVPQLNGFFEQGAFRAGNGVHVGWAVSLRGGGLVAPAIRDADRKPVPQLMAGLRDLVQRARTGGLRSSEITDPTVTVTSLGERGAESVFGVIYPPQVALIGFGRLAERPWLVGGRVAPRLLVQASLAADHRASDGHLGGQLLAAIDAALQQPHTL